MKILSARQHSDGYYIAVWLDETAFSADGRYPLPAAIASLFYPSNTPPGQILQNIKNDAQTALAKYQAGKEIVMPIEGLEF